MNKAVGKRTFRFQWVLLLVVAALGLIGANAQQGANPSGPTGAVQDSPAAPAQPVAFSHKLHAGQMKMACKACHTNPDPGEMMGIPAADQCMQCHAQVKTDSPEIRKIAEAAGANRPIPWVRVYAIPSYVFFSHRAHIEAENTCAECHGQVAQRDRLFREADISMGGCMDCHSKKAASNDCSFCHETR